MPVKPKFRQRPASDYLWFEVFERRTAEDYITFYAAAVDESNRTGINRILMDSHESVQPSVLWIYEAAKSMPRSPPRRVAALYRNQEVFNAISAFLEAASAYRGNALKTFHDPDEALKWLLGDGAA